MKSPKNVEEFISNYPPEVQEILKKIQATIKKAAPDAVETLGYGIPTFKLQGKNLVHFAAFKQHIGFFPGPEAIETFKLDLGAYETSKGTIRFPLDQPIPYDLIDKITRYRVAAISSKSK